jgi:zinc/manganese transport system ATP-binding protein
MTKQQDTPLAAISLDNLTVSYRQHPALHHISGQFAQGSLTAVMGPNGSGKSTLLKSLVGLLPTQGGRARSTAVTFHARVKRVAYLPQVSEIDRNFPLDVQDCVLLGCWAGVGAMGRTSPARQAQVEAALIAVGLQGFERRPLSTLSSGQLQRVMFARLLVQDADVILLDEPFNALDTKTTASLMLLVQQWHQQKRTVITVLHDERQARQYFPQTLLLAREQIAWGSTATVLTSENLHRARAMAEAWDESSELCEIDA